MPGDCPCACAYLTSVNQALAFELVMFTTRSSAIFVVKMMAKRFDPATIWRTPVKNLIVPKSRTHSRSCTRINLKV